MRGLAPEVEENAFEEKFAECGDIERVKIPKDPTSGQSRGFGFITFKKSESAQQALEKFNNYTFEGQVLEVQISKREQPRPNTPGKYMGPGRRGFDRGGRGFDRRDGDRGRGMRRYGDRGGDRFGDRGGDRFGGRDNRYGDNKFGGRGRGGDRRRDDDFHDRRNDRDFRRGDRDNHNRDRDNRYY